MPAVTAAQIINVNQTERYERGCFTIPTTTFRSNEFTRFVLKRGVTS